MRTAAAALAVVMAAGPRGLLAGAALTVTVLLAPVAVATAPAPAVAAMLSDRDLALYRAAFAAADAGHWDEARRTAAHAREALPAKAITWMALSQPTAGATFEEITAFIDANPTWPGLVALRKQAEMVVPPGIDSTTLLAWFDRFPPLTMRGTICDADALIAAGQQAKAAELVRERWINGNFTADDEREFRGHFDDLLRRRDHIARLDRLAWDGDGDAARRLFPLVPPAYRALAQARLALADGRGDVDALLASVPIELRGDPGLRYDRLRWRRLRNEDAGAIAILNNPPSHLDRPLAWWTERHILIRRVMEQHQYSLAYRLATKDGQTDPQTLWQAEFLSGWLALRFLDRPNDALPHFQRLYDIVTTPASQARGAYWLARTYDALGRPDDARRWYRTAAKVPTNYYGQLALEHLGLSIADALPADPVIGAAATATFNRNELVRLVRMLHEIDAASDRDVIFLRRIGMDVKTPEQLALAIRLANEVGRRDLAVFIGKLGIQNNIAFVAGAYPTIRARGIAPELALVHGLIRQESIFNKTAISPAGAEGLMQLMPSTAAHVARTAGVPFAPHRLLTDASYNVRLGSAFLQDLLDRFGGSYELAIAAYNAGTRRVVEWLHTYGDPRTGNADTMVDWVESIPIYETRNYVQRVIENLKVYRSRSAMATAAAGPVPAPDSSPAP